MAEAVATAGRTFSPDEIDLIVEVVSRFSKLSRFELANTVCELVGWERASGRLKARECRDLLEHLEQHGLIKLPGKRPGRPARSATSVPWTACGEKQVTIAGDLPDVTPVRIEVVRRAEQQRVWRELVGRYHYLGFATPFGAQLRYLVTASRPAAGTIVGCLQYSSAAWRLAARDRWVGWSDAVRARRLSLVVQQSRFLLLPWVRVRHLASHVLALSARRVVTDWAERYGQRPLLLETMVDEARFRGTCYRAANWIDVGVTSGRGRRDRRGERHGAAVKRVFVYPLAPAVQRRLQPGG